MALAYKEELEQLEPNVTFLMTLYLSTQLTVEEVAKAKAAGIVGIQLYFKAEFRRQVVSKVFSY
jgi:dihydroorotase